MNNNIISFKGICVWLVCVFFYLYEFMLRTILGTFQPSLMHDLGLNSYDFALLSSTAYLLIYALMQLPVGFIISRFGLKMPMVFAASLCTLATLGFSMCDSFTSAVIFRSLMGLGSAFGFIGVMISVYSWMPYKNIALFIGLSQFLGTLGPMAVAGPLEMLVNSSSNITWRACFYVLCLVGLALTIVMALVIKENTKKEDSFIILNKPSELKKELFQIVKESQVWYIAISYALLYFSLEYLSENEGRNLMMSKGFSSSFSSNLITLSWLGFAISCPIIGFFSDKIQRRKNILLAFSLLNFISLTAIIYLPLSRIGALVAFFVYGVGIGSSSVGIAIMAEQFKYKHISTGLSLKNTVTILFVSLMAPFISFLLTLITQKNQNSILLLGDFQQVFILIAAFPCIASLIILFKVKETYGRSAKEAVILNYKSTSMEP